MNSDFVSHPHVLRGRETLLVEVEPERAEGVEFLRFIFYLPCSWSVQGQLDGGSLTDSVELQKSEQFRVFVKGYLLPNLAEVVALRLGFLEVHHVLTEKLNGVDCQTLHYL